MITSLQLPSFIPKREEKLVLNSYSIVKHPHPDDFSIVIYYINDNQGKLIIRRLDSDDPWGQDLKIKIIDANDSSMFEIINVGSSSKNDKQMTFTTYTICLKPIQEKEIQIPKIIMQSNDKDHYENLQHYNAIHSLIELNPSYEYIYFNGIQRRKYIKQYMDIKTLETYDKIVSKTFKSDFFRYIFLYVQGGCYFDHKFVLKKSLHFIISSNVSNILCWDIGIEKLQNGIMMACPKEPFLYNIIQKIISNVDRMEYGRDVLEPTGPVLLYQIAKNQNIALRFEKESPSKYYREETIVVDSTKELIGYRYYNQYYQKRKYESYGHLWGQRLIYSPSLQHFQDYTIVVYPNTWEHTEKIESLKTKKHRTKKVRQYYESLIRHLGWIMHKDRFHFEIEGQNLMITRVDEPYGWDLELKIQLINKNTHQTQDIYIGSSKHFTKIQKIPI